MSFIEKCMWEATGWTALRLLGTVCWHTILDDFYIYHLPWDIVTCPVGIHVVWPERQNVTTTPTSNRQQQCFCPGFRVSLCTERNENMLKDCNTLFTYWDCRQIALLLEESWVLVRVTKRFLLLLICNRVQKNNTPRGHNGSHVGFSHENTCCQSNNRCFNKCSNIHDSVSIAVSERLMSHVS